MKQLFHCLINCKIYYMLFVVVSLIDPIKVKDHERR
jgi:hypothetical protein